MYANVCSVRLYSYSYVRYSYVWMRKKLLRKYCKGFRYLWIQGITYLSVRSKREYVFWIRCTWAVRNRWKMNRSFPRRIWRVCSVLHLLPITYNPSAELAYKNLSFFYISLVEIFILYFLMCSLKMLFFSKQHLFTPTSSQDMNVLRFDTCFCLKLLVFWIFFGL